MLSPNEPASYIPMQYHDITIRVHRHTDLGNIWFCLADICKVLKITNPSHISKKISNEYKHLHKIHDRKRNVPVLWVSYKGLTELFDQLVDVETLVHFWYWCRRISIITR